jgi:glucose-1-phosphate cytidylyltransferase
LKVVLLCGGMGTRLREETEVRPKPMIEIGHRPILWHIMKIYSHYGYTDFVLCLGYKGDFIRRYFLDYHLMNCDVTLDMRRPHQISFHQEHDAAAWRVTLAETGPDTMTAGRLKRIQCYLQDDDTFLMTYGDGVADIDIARLVEFHKSHGRIATVTGVHPSSRWGELVVDGDQVKEFREKPQIKDGFINGGFFVLSRAVFEYLGDDETVPFERAPMARLTADGQLMVYQHAGYWQAMDTLRDMTLLNEEWHSGHAPWKVWP